MTSIKVSRGRNVFRIMSLYFKYCFISPNTSIYLSNNNSIKREESYLVLWPKTWHKMREFHQFSVMRQMSHMILYFFLVIVKLALVNSDDVKLGVCSSSHQISAIDVHSTRLHEKFGRRGRENVTKPRTQLKLHYMP